MVQHREFYLANDSEQLEGCGNGGSGRVFQKKAAARWLQAAERVKTLIDCIDRCSQWPDEERPCPTNGRVDRVAGGIVTAVSAEGQLIALLHKDKRVSLGWSFCGVSKNIG